MLLGKATHNETKRSKNTTAKIHLQENRAVCVVAGLRTRLFKRAGFCSQECLDASRVEFKRKTESGERKKFNPPYDELFDLYINKCYSIKQLMDHYGCKQRSVYSILKRNNLPTLKYRDEYRQKLGLV